MVYIDEAGADNRLFRPYARALRGHKVYAYIPGRKRERHSMIGGWMRRKFMAPFTFQGTCNADVFNTWLAQVLLPTVPKGTTIVMDNASFHKSAQTKELIAKTGCHLLFLPTYSPDLNPIEHVWHQIKSMLRPLVQQSCESFQEKLERCLLSIA